MGGNQSKPISLEPELENTFLWIPQKVEPDKTLQFDPSQSRLLAFTVAQTASPRTKQLSNINNDTAAVTDALIEKGVILEENYRLYNGEKQCTFSKIEARFKNEAEKVGEEGVFIFLFSGHGIAPSNEQFGLVPADFDGKGNTLSITANTLKQWLRTCRAKHVLFLINCCYAGQLARTPVLSTDEQPICPSSVYVMASSTANQKSFAISTLRHSVFCYFLSYAIENIEIPSGQLPIHAIYKKCCHLSKALSSLLYTYNEGILQHKQMDPELTYLPHPSRNLDGNQFSPMTFYDHTKRTMLHNISRKYIMFCVKEGGCLSQLKNEGALADQRVVNTVLCCMLRTMACIHLAINWDILKNGVNFFITVYMEIMTAIVSVYDAKFGREEFLVGLSHYMSCIDTKKRKVLQEFYLQVDENPSTLQSEDIDFGGPVSNVFVHWYIHILYGVSFTVKTGVLKT